MAARLLVRGSGSASRLAEKLLSSPSSFDHKSSDILRNEVRAFGSSAVKQSGDDDSVQVARRSGNNAPSERRRSRRFLPNSLLPSIFSPIGQSTSLMQMMDTMDRFLNNFPVMEPSQFFRDVNARLPWDVMEDDKSFKLRVDMPGMPKEEVKLVVEDDDLVLKAEHKADEEGNEWTSRSYGSYNFRINLPQNVDRSGIKAELKDGVLMVQAPKVEVKKEQHTVQIE